jgi:penicillin-binding protein 1B
LNAVLAIEDSQFLNHSGFSLTSIARAIYNNVFGSGIKQGASTITQQLVKNYFLTPEKTLRRKAREFFLAVALETIASKDLILETYLNIIYLGQSGPFQIRGFPAASQFYFQKDIESLEVHECALLAAVLNSPGLYDPFKKPQNAFKRRNLVLERMVSLGFITDEETQLAKNTPLPQTALSQAAETAPYFIQAVNKELSEKNVFFTGGAVFTTMDLFQQAAAQQAVNEGVEKILQAHPKLKEKPEALQSLFLSVDVRSGGVTSLVGGRSYRTSQFNRAIQGHRQIGSLMKPFVFLSAFLNSDTNTPMTEILDEKKIYEYEGQSWSPENYDKKFNGAVPMYFALKNSLNAATANLGMQVGLEKIIETAKNLGVESELKALPSLTLGAFELYANEVAQSYLTLANFGRFQKISFVESVVSTSGEVLYQRNFPAEDRLSPSKVAMLVGIMRQTLLTGTAKGLKSFNFASEVAGKSGTTSDHKDAWFAGFSPHLLAVAWVGFDDNTSTKLTGSSGPAPIWGQFIKSTEDFFSKDLFHWPANTEKRISPEPTEVLDPPDYLIFSN